MSFLITDRYNNHHKVYTLGVLSAAEILMREPYLSADFPRADINLTVTLRRDVDPCHELLLHTDGSAAAAHISCQRKQFLHVNEFD